MGCWCLFDVYSLMYVCTYTYLISIESPSLADYYTLGFTVHPFFYFTWLSLIQNFPYFFQSLSIGLSTYQNWYLYSFNLTHIYIQVSSIHWYRMSYIHIFLKTLTRSAKISVRIMGSYPPYTPTSTRQGHLIYTYIKPCTWPYLMIYNMI